MSTPSIGPVAQELSTAGLRSEVVKKGQRQIRAIDSNRLRVMSADVLGAVADRFGGEKVAALLDELCVAECITNGGRKIPDNRTRLAAVTLVLAYLVGRPIERQEIISVNMGADDEQRLLERLVASPALRQAFRKALDEADAKALSVGPNNG
ncbi:MAG: hypothetical protein QM627_12875 [Luteolibacter sp.]